MSLGTRKQGSLLASMALDRYPEMLLARYTAGGGGLTFFHDQETCCYVRRKGSFFYDERNQTSKVYLLRWNVSDTRCRYRVLLRGPCVGHSTTAVVHYYCCSQIAVTTIDADRAPPRRSCDNLTFSALSSLRRGSIISRKPRVYLLYAGPQQLHITTQHTLRLGALLSVVHLVDRKPQSLWTTATFKLTPDKHSAVW